MITGATRGLGAVIAHTLAGQGAAVAVHYRQSSAQAQALCADLAARGAIAVPVQADLLDAGAIPPMIADVVAFGHPRRTGSPTLGDLSR